jgi:hypothetical protein
LRTPVDGRYRHRVQIAAAACVTGAMFACVLGGAGCTSIDPGTNYVVPLQDFNASYFYCFVEPNYIFGKGCGDDGSHGCHYSNKVPELVLVEHDPVTCVNGQPTDMTQIGVGSPAQSNLSAVSLQMDTDYLDAPIYTWPTQIVAAHPKQVFMPGDPVVQYLATWATE